jgi:hypothetical protein
MKNTIITRTAEISFSPQHRIIRIKLIEGSEIELNDTIQNKNAILTLTRGSNYLALVDIRVNVTVSKEARAYAALAENNLGRIASAFIITSTANKLIGNFFINVNKPEIPTRIFSSEESATKWLNEFLYLTEIKKEYSSL